MASKLVVAVALFAVCQSSPVDEFRGKRSYTNAVGTSVGWGSNKASAVADGNKADAQAVNDNGGNIAYDALGNSLPSQAYARVGTSDNSGDAVGLGYAQPAYYPLPAPATVVTYQKYADVPAEIPSQFVYEAQPTPVLAQSSAASHGGFGSAASNADTNSGSAASIANTQGQGSASSVAQSNGPLVQVVPAVIAAKNQGFHSAYNPAYTPVGYNSASSQADVSGYHGSANSAARSGAVPTRKSISWRFGTAYDQPASYGAAKAAARSDVPQRGSISSTAHTYGSGSAQSAADHNGYGSSVRSASTTHGGGHGSANANVNEANYAVLRSDPGYPGYGGIRSFASTNNAGSAISQADNEHVNSAARSDAGGSADSGAYKYDGQHGLRSSGAWGGRIASDSHSTGVGNAASSARTQGLSTGYRVSSIANSGPQGSARSNAYGI